MKFIRDSINYIKTRQFVTTRSNLPSNKRGRSPYSPMRRPFVRRSLRNLIVLPREQSRERCLRLGEIPCLLSQRKSYPLHSKTSPKLIVSKGLRPVDLSLGQGRHDLSVGSRKSKSNVRTPQASSPRKPTIINRQSRPTLASTSSTTKVRTK